LTVRIRDLTPRFLDFFEVAGAESAEGDRLWELWRERYGFAAVPGTPQGRDLARRQLEASWEDYPALLPRIRAGIGGMEKSPEELLSPVADLLELDRPMEVEVILFVGTRGGSAFSLASGDRWQMALPIEEDPEEREVTASHEMAHGVHTELAGLRGEWYRSLGQMVLGEGLAMRVAAALYPGRDPWAYTGGGEGWYREAQSREIEILRGVLTRSDNATPRVLDRFTVGTGPAGMRREAYYAGWALVGHLLENGWTLPGLARVPRGFMGRVVDRGLSEMLGEGYFHERPGAAESGGPSERFEPPKAG
jgi:hypothetical protein